MSDNPFAPEPPRSDHDILRDIWYSMDEILKRHLPEIRDQVKTTNGRVSSLEKFRYAIVGGLAVVTAVVVPLFVKVVSG